jgi:serine/threonine protein kinase/tetratricopeptide (TPR) repeat protein
MTHDGQLKGRAIRGYELGDLLGRGGYGAVYRAYQPAIQREVAIKVILPEHATQEEFVRNFEVEAQLVARLEHPHIVPLYDFWRETGPASDAGAYLVMRYLRRGSLRAYLKEHGALDIGTTARYLDQIASALATAHRGGIVHRDLKPDNILLDDAGNAYLTDFGIAKPVGYMVTDGLVTGTLAYIAPEQLEGKPPQPQSDLYSLGYVLYEMLAGSHPFPNASVTDLLMKHLHDPIAPLHLTHAAAPLIDAINAVIGRMTAKSPAERYPDALAAAAAFRQALRTLDGTASGMLPVAATPAPPDPPAVLDTDGSRQSLLQGHIDQLYGQLNQLYKLLSPSSVSAPSPSDAPTNPPSEPYDGHTLPPTPAVGFNPILAGGESPTLRARIEQLKVEIAYRSASLEAVKQYAAFNPTPALTPPAPPAHALVGLDATLPSLRERLLTGASLTLLGPSGVGKTELAAALARDPAVVNAFERRIAWISVGKGGDVFEPLGEWLRALGATADDVGGLRTRGERMKRLAEWLGGRPWLIVLDDLWRLDGLQDTLLDRRYGLTCLITTRQATVAADAFWEIVHLRELPNIARLAMLEALCPGFTPDDDGRRLVERVGGLPRDLLLTGSRLRRAGGSTSRLRREIDRLTQAPVEVLEGGYAALRLSVEELSAEARRAFADIAVFPPEPALFSEAAGEAVVGDLFYLDELVDCSLLRADETPDGATRYALHPSIAEYALKYEPPDPAAVEAFLTHSIDFIDEYARDFDRAAPEMRIIEAALRRMADSPERADALVRAVVALTPCWKARGMVELAATYLNEALRVAEAGAAGDFPAPLIAVAQLRLLLAELALDLGERDHAEAHVAAGLAALEGARESAMTGDAAEAVARLRVQLATQRGVLAYTRRDLPAAQAIWSELLDSPDLARYPAEMARAHNGLATVALFATSDYAAARAHFLKGLEEARRARQHEVVLMTLNNLGQLEHHYLNETAAAVAHLEESLGLARAVGDYRRTSYALQALANIALSAGRVEQAQTYFEEALQKARASRGVERIGFALMQLANLLAMRDAFDEAEAHLAESLKTAVQREDAALLTQIINVLTKTASARVVKSRFAPLAPAYADALTAATANGLPAERAASLQAALDRMEAARALLDVRAPMLEAHLTIGRLERDDFYDAKAALHHFAAALQLAEGLGQPATLAHCLLEMAATHQAEGEAEPAASYRDRAAALIAALPPDDPDAPDLRARLDALQPAGESPVSG